MMVFIISKSFESYVVPQLSPTHSSRYPSARFPIYVIDACQTVDNNWMALCYTWAEKRNEKHTETKRTVESERGDTKSWGERKLKRDTNTYQVVSSLISICECEMQSHLHIAHTPCGSGLGPSTYLQHEQNRIDGKKNIF